MDLDPTPLKTKCNENEREQDEQLQPQVSKIENDFHSFHSYEKGNNLVDNFAISFEITFQNDLWNLNCMEKESMKQLQKIINDNGTYSA